MFHITVEGCRSQKNGMDGFLFAHTNYASLAGSLSRSNGRHGLMIADGDRAMYLTRNTFTDDGRLSSRGCGIAVGESDSDVPRGVYALANNVTDARRAGVCVHSGEMVSLNRNRIANMRDKEATCYDARRELKETNGVCKVLSTREYRLAKVKNEKKRCPQRGIRNGKVCCARKCRVCKKKGCKKRGANKACCPNVIKKMERSCKKFAPPCML